MGKYFCDYCQSYLTHDSLSVRKNHLHGKQHLKLYNEYYERIANEYPEYSGKNADPSVDNTLLSEVYKSIPGVTNKYADQHQRDSGYKHTFKLHVPSTSVGLPNPPPNVLFVNYSNYVQKNRVGKPYHSNGNGNSSYGHGHRYGTSHSNSGYNRSGNRSNYQGRDREGSPRTHSGTGRGAPGNADFNRRSQRSSTPVRTETQNGYGYGYGHESKDRPTRPAGTQGGYGQNRTGYGSPADGPQQQQQQRSRQGYQPRYKQGYQRYSGQQGRSRDYY